MTELPATLTGLQRALREGLLSPREALLAQRQRLAPLAAQFQSVVHTLPADPAPGSSGALAGIGLAHKDIFNISNWRPGAGHDRGAAAPGLLPAAAIARLQSHGAATLATLSMAEYACGATGENLLLGRPVNPLMAQAVVGGSSSGSAVAVASGLAYGSLGTDTAGSVRIPAATCAVLGLKTTHGLISTQGVLPLAPSLDSVGILGRSAGDAAQLLAAVADPARLRPVTAQPLRIKAWLPDAGLHNAVATALEAFARQCGVRAWISHWPDFQTLTQLSEIVLHAEAADTHRSALLAGRASAAVEAVALAGLVLPPDWSRAALADRARRTQAFVQEHLSAHDLLILPALPDPVPDWTTVSPGHPDFQLRQLLGLHRYMAFVNYLGCPSLVLPIARDARGLPISAQVIARPFHEPALLAWAAAVEHRLYAGGEWITAFSKQG
jgi:Asp-tRNA(Asn)/Glu-tRNA(Gln) amidotransferase A subunit family amidase